MRTILFVDDDQNVLSGLKRLLRPMRGEWDVYFAPGGKEALELMSQQHFDVLVSDMRMPGMDGLALMNEATTKYPNMVRIVLSGHASEETSVRLAGTAHQFLAKPCDANKLKATIDRAFALRDLLTDDVLQQSLAQMRSIPSMPDIYAELMKELEYPDASVRRVGEIISKDPGMTAKLLQLVNSAFFGIPRQVSDPSQAAALLGTDTLRSLVLGIEVFSQFEGTDCGAIGLQSLWEHSRETGRIARAIASAENASREVIDASGMAGILHDVGKIILAHNLPDKYSEVVKATANGDVAAPQAERDILGASHTEVGAYVLGLWGLPDEIVEAVAFHHCPSESFGDEFAPLTALHVADALAHEVASTEGTGIEDKLDMKYLGALGLTDRIGTWRERCTEPQAAGDRK